MANKNRNSSGASRGSQWENLLRKFSQAHKEQCKAVSVQIPKVRRSLKQFPTGSLYEGEWDVLGMSGEGIYTLPNGVIYKGQLDDGLFHGKGEMQYPNGVVLKGRWVRGEMVERRLFFADGLEYSEVDWKYCKMPDRRFTIEYSKGLQPHDRTYQTADQPTREVPLGYYDTGDGFFCPNTKMVYDPNDLTAIIRAPTKHEQKWIVENCRTNPIETVGPRPDLYERWQEPNIDHIETPEPAVPTRRPTPPSTSNKIEFEQEILQWQIQDDNVEAGENDEGTSLGRRRWYKRRPIRFDPTLEDTEPDPSTPSLMDCPPPRVGNFRKNRMVQSLSFQQDGLEGDDSISINFTS